jgi:beta-glucosidase/6-phospho-beta-glucosidase/beta-galactosidase
MEWYCGYGPRLGVTYVDRANGFKRYPKDSTKVVAAWFQSAIQRDGKGVKPEQGVQVQV